MENFLPDTPALVRGVPRGRVPNISSYHEHVLEARNTCQLRIRYLAISSRLLESLGFAIVEKVARPEQFLDDDVTLELAHEEEDEVHHRFTDLCVCLSVVTNATVGPSTKCTASISWRKNALQLSNSPLSPVSMRSSALGRAPCCLRGDPPRRNALLHCRPPDYAI